MIEIKRKLLLINILFFLILFEILFSIVSKEYNIITLSRYSIIKQDEFTLIDSNTEFNFPKKYNEYFKSMINKDFGISQVPEHTIETAAFIREKLLNQGLKKNGEYLFSRYPDKLYYHLKSNKPLLCGEIARLYGYILHLYDFKVRYITIARSIFDSFDRHSTIEIWDEKRGKWIISDATFNISFKIDTIYLSSDELYDLIHSGKTNLITVIHENKTKYETPIEEYYISYYSLFNNIYFIKNIETFRLSELPPLRWFDDNYKIYLVQSFIFPIRGSSIKIQNTIMFFILFLIPVLIILIILYFIYDKLKIRFYFTLISFSKTPSLARIIKHLKN